MKKSKAISLILVTGLLGCNNQQKQNRLYMRTDSTGTYTPSNPHFGGYYAFRPFGTYYGGSYIRQGYYNDAVHVSESHGISRGGFGGSEGFHVSS